MSNTVTPTGMRLNEQIRQALNEIEPWDEVITYGPNADGIELSDEDLVPGREYLQMARMHLRDIPKMYKYLYVDPSNQRPKYWGLKKKQKLVLSVFTKRGIPEHTLQDLYRTLRLSLKKPDLLSDADKKKFLKILKKGKQDSVTDGQHRFGDYDEFMSDGFPFQLAGRRKYFTAVNGRTHEVPAKGWLYSELPEDLREIWDNYTIYMRRYAGLSSEEHGIYFDLMNDGEAMSAAELRNKTPGETTQELRELWNGKDDGDGTDGLRGEWLTYWRASEEDRKNLPKPRMKFKFNMKNVKHEQPSWLSRRTPDEKGLMWFLCYTEYGNDFKGKGLSGKTRLDKFVATNAHAGTNALKHFSAFVINEFVPVWNAFIDHHDRQMTSTEEFDIINLLLSIKNYKPVSYEVKPKEFVDLFLMKKKGITAKLRIKHAFTDEQWEEWANTSADERKLLGLKDPNIFCWRTSGKGVWGNVKRCNFRKNVLDDLVKKNIQRWFSDGVVIQRKKDYTLEYKKKLCEYGRVAPGITMQDVEEGRCHVDHFIPRAKGGRVDSSNEWLMVDKDNESAQDRDKFEWFKEKRPDVDLPAYLKENNLEWLADPEAEAPSPEEQVNLMHCLSEEIETMEEETEVEAGAA